MPPEERTLRQPGRWWSGIPRSARSCWSVPTCRPTRPRSGKSPGCRCSTSPRSCASSTPPSSRPLTDRSMETADVLIIGGGIAGLSIAYHLARRGAGRIVVLERAGQVGTGSTAKATGGIRHQFSSEINVRLTQLSLPEFEHFEDELGEPIDFVQHGYL